MPMRIAKRIAKRIAAAGICSRREAERLIEAGRVVVNNQRITSPALNVSDDDRITVDGQLLASVECPRLWLYHKPAGLVTSHQDEQGRETVFDTLPKQLPRVISVGRLDLNSEGLLLLTNNGALARKMELPSSGYERIYRVRSRGQITPAMLKKLASGMTVDGMRYAPAKAVIDQQQASNCWLTVTLTEGKNREIRKLFEALGCRVGRLIRIQYGTYQLGKLGVGEVQEVVI